MGFSSANTHLSNLTDDELITIINSNNSVNNQNAFIVLMERYIDVIRIKAVSYRNSSTEFDDFVQEGLIALLNAVKNYKTSGEASFSTYSNICIERRFNSVYKSEKRLKDIPKNLIVPLNDKDVSNSYYTEDNPLQNIIEREELQIHLANIKSNLSDFEQNVFSYYLNGYSYKQTAIALKTSDKSIDNAIQRIRKKLKKINCSEYLF